MNIYTQYWNNKERLIIVCDEGSIFVDITISPNKLDKKAFIWGLNVNPDFRGIGVGSSLLKFAEDCIRDQSINKVELEWESSSSSLWVYDWYIRKGYEEIDFSEGYSRLQKTLWQLIERTMWDDEDYSYLDENEYMSLGDIEDLI